jgi:hypothetical protein
MVMQMRLCVRISIKSAGFLGEDERERVFGRKMGVWEGYWCGVTLVFGLKMRLKVKETLDRVCKITKEYGKLRKRSEMALE